MGSGPSKTPAPAPAKPVPSREFSRRPVFTDEDSTGFRRQIFVMYHATKRQNLASIVKNGFKLSTIGMLGPGIYLSRDINKTRAYGDVCLKVLVYTGKTVKVHSSDNQGSWRGSFDSAYLPPNNNVVASGFDETCVKSNKQVNILGIAYGYHRSGMNGGVRNLEGTNDELDGEERMVLEKMVRNLSWWGKFVDMFYLPLPLPNANTNALVLAVVWMLLVAMDVSLGVWMEDVVTWPLAIVRTFTLALTDGVCWVLTSLCLCCVVLVGAFIKMVVWIVSWPIGWIVSVGEMVAWLAAWLGWPASVELDVASKAAVLRALFKLVTFVYRRIFA